MTYDDAAQWVYDNDIDLEDFLSETEAGRRRMVENIANQHYVEERTETFVHTLDNPRFWDAIETGLIGHSEEVYLNIEGALYRANTEQDFDTVHDRLTRLPESNRRDDLLHLTNGFIGAREELAQKEIESRQPIPRELTEPRYNLNDWLRIAREEGLTNTGGRLTNKITAEGTTYDLYYFPSYARNDRIYGRTWVATHEGTQRPVAIFHGTKPTGYDLRTRLER